MYEKNKITRSKKQLKKALVRTSVASFLFTLFFAYLSPLSFSQGPEIPTVDNSTSTELSSSANNTQTQQQEESTNTVHISKSSTNSYSIVDDQTGLVGTFGTSYTIIGGSDSLNKSKALIISMVQDDFGKSPTIGYIRAANVTDPAVPAASIANPFVDQQTVNSTIAEKLSGGIDTAQGLYFTTVAIKCDFDMNIKDWNCDAHGIFD